MLAYQNDSNRYSFGALPRQAWMTLGIIELVCTIGLILPAAFGWQPVLSVVAASILAIESLVFIGVDVKYRENATIIMCVVLGFSSWRSSPTADWS
jgi:hypothetical protein